jgi:hypothetical protein
MKANVCDDPTFESDVEKLELSTLLRNKKYSDVLEETISERHRWGVNGR